MNWLEGLLEPLLDRLAMKLAAKVRGQLNSAIDAALDRADDRIDKAFEGLEERLLAVATKPIADLKEALGPGIDLQRHLLEQKNLRAEWVTLQRQALEQQAPKPIADPKAAVTSPVRPFPTEQEVRAAAELAGLIPPEVATEQITTTAQAATADAMEQLRMKPFLVKDAATGLMRPRHTGERPDR